MSFILALALAIGGQEAANVQGRDEAVRLAVDVLSHQLGVDAQSLTVVTAEAVEWPDSSLGCPERDMVYLPSLVSGFRVILEEGGRRHEVHTGAGRAVVCGGATPAHGARATRAVAPALAAADRARRHLATTLEIPPADLTTKLVRAWRPTDRGCDPPADAKIDEPTFLVTLAHGDRTWRYRATPLRAWQCLK